MDYREAGVDVKAGQAFVERIRNLVRTTNRPEVIGGLGGFSGCFQLPGGFKEPVLVSGTDGVGTKLKLAQVLNCHHTVGIDLVAMCVNDVLTTGAEPLFFLDYLATGKLQSEQLAAVVTGITSGCKKAGCALLGGETAEMPGFYPTGEYDLAGFCVGIVEKSRMLDGSQVKIGDKVIALASNGIHSNGFSLVRKIVDESNYNWDSRIDETDSRNLGEICLTPTQIYVKPVLAALTAGLEIHGMAHITGGGLPENLPRCLGENQSIKVDCHNWAIPPIFDWLAKVGSINNLEMFNTFNMGIGLVVLVPPNQARQAISWFNSQEIATDEIGEVIAGTGKLEGLEDVV